MSLEGINFCLMTFSFISKRTLNLKLAKFQVGAYSCCFSTRCVLVVHECLDLFLQTDFLFFSVFQAGLHSIRLVLIQKTLDVPLFRIARQLVPFPPQSLVIEFAVPQFPNIRSTHTEHTVCNVFLSSLRSLATLTSFSMS
jgi:hypothetical protein